MSKYHEIKLLGAEELVATFAEDFIEDNLRLSKPAGEITLDDINEAITSAKDGLKGLGPESEDSHTHTRDFYTSTLRILNIAKSGIELAAKGELTLEKIDEIVGEAGSYSAYVCDFCDYNVPQIYYCEESDTSICPNCVERIKTIPVNPMAKSEKSEPRVRQLLKRREKYE